MNPVKLGENGAEGSELAQLHPEDWAGGFDVSPRQRIEPNKVNIVAKVSST